ELMSIADSTGILHPLDTFYAGQKLPEVTVIEGSAVPEPYQTLLVHNGDMTPALESFHKGTIHLRLMQTRQEKDAYFREVLLLLDGSDKPVEFGAIKINLEHFDAASRADILQGRRPLGTIMRQQHVAHTSRPVAFL